MTHSHFTRRWLRFESLEDRRMLATYSVSTNLDVVDQNDDVLSLREAIIAANASDEADEIVFDFGHDGPETIVLTQGELEISDTLTITGPGSSLLTIDASGNDPTPDENNGDGSRAINAIGGLDSDMELILSGMRFIGGDTEGAGGAIRAEFVKHLEVREVVAEFNHATGKNDAFLSSVGIDGGGGGIATIATAALINESTFRSNTAGWGAGLFSWAGELACIESHFTGNDGGQAIWLDGGKWSIIDCDVSENNAQGLFAYYPEGTIEGSRFQGNTGGGVEILLAFKMVVSNTLIAGPGIGLNVVFRAPSDIEEVTLINSTIVASQDDAIVMNELLGQPYGGRVHVLSSTVHGDVVVHNNVSLTSMNSIIDGSLLVDSPEYGFVVANHTFIGSTEALPETGLLAPDASGNYVGGPVGGVIAPLLGPLAHNGGSTPTLRPISTSLVIDAGDPTFDLLNPYPAADEALFHDQRGAPFDRLVGNRIDMGAVEYNPQLKLGDYNGDLTVDMADYLVWRNSLGTQIVSLSGADGSGDGVVDAVDYLVWKSHYGDTYPDLPPEQASLSFSMRGIAPGLSMGLPLEEFVAKRREFRPADHGSNEPPAVGRARDEAILLLTLHPSARQQPPEIDPDMDRTTEDELSDPEVVLLELFAAYEVGDIWDQ